MASAPNIAGPGTFRLTQLWRYPIKGLPGETLKTARLSAGAHFPGDRRYAIGTGHDKVADNQWLKKAYFLQLMTYEEMAAVACQFEGEQVHLAHARLGTLSASMAEESGRASIAAFFDRLLEGRLRGQARMVKIESGAFTDTKAPLVSLGGSASFTGFSELTGTLPDPRRFRLNMIFQTATPFEETALVGKTLAIGEARLRVVDPVGRCAAIDVDPDTALRGPHYLPEMEKALGHSDLGIFAEIIGSGMVGIGDRITVLD